MIKGLTVYPIRLISLTNHIPMIRNLTYLFAVGMLLSALNAQSQSSAEKAPFHQAPTVSLSEIGSVQLRGAQPVNPAPAALFDLQLTVNLDSAGGTGAYYGVCWTGTEFWASKWNRDTLFSLSPTGVLTSTFVIPGVGASGSGVRGMTTDGIFIYAADNTSTIKVIDPTTKTLLNTLPTSLTFAPRSITYDSAANGGVGGFWVSNFGSDIALLDMNGALVTGIPAATHGQGGISGMAVDNTTAGGPYLWVFNQGPPSNSTLVRLQLPAGTPTVVTRNVNADVGPASGGNTGTAAGINIGSGFVAGVPSIFGVIQGTPNDVLFAYELNDVTLLSDDASLDSTNWQPSYTVVPTTQVTPFVFPTVVSNKGTNSIAGVSLQVEVSQGASVVYLGNASASNLASGSSATIAPTTTFTPSGTGVYNVFNSITLSGATDLNGANDTTSFRLAVSDSVYARDNGLRSGSLGIGNGTGGLLGQYFAINAAARISSATFVLSGPTLGDSTRVVVYSTVSGHPSGIIGFSPAYIFTAADTDGVVLTLPITTPSGAQLNAAIGTYMLAVQEYGSNITLGTSEYNWRPNVTGVLFGANPWTPNEGYNFKRVYLLRMNLASSTQGVAELNSADGIQILPNPATGVVQLQSTFPITSLRVVDLNGKEVLRHRLESGQIEFSFNVDFLSRGMYMVEVAGRDGQVRLTRLIKH
jgi:hypothetical protein